jgi:hypothetical protein
MSLTWGSSKFSSETGKSSITTRRFFAAMLDCRRTIESVGVCNNRGMLRKTVQTWDISNTIWHSNKRMYQRFYPKSDQTLINLCLKFHHFSSCRPDFCLGHDCESFVWKPGPLVMAPKTWILVHFWQVATCAHVSQRHVLHFLAFGLCESIIV